jgi:hypothetical protein
MDLKSEVRAVMLGSKTALTVDQVAAEVAERIKGEIRSILNSLDKAGELTSVHGGGSYRTQYVARTIERRI